MCTFLLLLFALMHNQILPRYIETERLEEPWYNKSERQNEPYYNKSEKQEEDDEGECDENLSITNKSKRLFTFAQLQYTTKLGLPIGYRFKPTEHEIVQIYLMNKVMNKPLPAPVIQDICSSFFYMNHPKNLVSNEVEQKEWYIFIQQEEKQFIYEKMRKVGNDVGFWLKEDENLDSAKGTFIGYNKYIYRFFRTSQKVPKKTHWKMHEYQLPQNIDWTLAKIIKGTNYERT